MSLTQEKKQEIISQYQAHETDTGSSALQVALLSARISQLTEHLKKNDKDYSCRRGLLKLIGQRKRLLNYIKDNKPRDYQNLIEKLGIRG